MTALNMMDVLKEFLSQEYTGERRKWRQREEELDRATNGQIMSSGLEAAFSCSVHSHYISSSQMDLHHPKDS